MKTINEEIKKDLLSEGAVLVGFADLCEFPTEVRDGYRYGISIAVNLSPDVVMRIGKGPSVQYYNEYKRVNNLLNQLAERGTEILKAKGFDALAKTQSIVKTDERTRRSKLPHKSVATKSGLGWIGKCALLVTKKYGSAIRITTVLTNAKLEVGIPNIDSKCGNCEDCKKICPAGAISGKNWKLSMDRDELLRAQDCKDKIISRGKDLGLTEGTCGLCIWACPWTQRYLKNSN